MTCRCSATSPAWLRLWRADATESFDFYAFNIGDYYGAVGKDGGETRSRCSTPNGTMKAGACASSSSTSS